VRVPLWAVLAFGLMIVVTACGTGGLSEGGDPARGRQLFIGQGGCGGCHTLADAGTRGTIGPDLDDAFAADRAQGFEESTIKEVVAGQIKFPLQGIELEENGETRDVNPTGGPVMPANLVRGKDVDDVAAYVASVAGKPVAGGGGGGKVTTTNGKQIFEQAGCGNCHTLADAGTRGTIGPNLDEAKPPKALVVTRVTNGKGAMPSFKSTLTPEQIQAVAQYVSSAAGK
jgi:mono/diheme cytochrome c family protein